MMHTVWRQIFEEHNFRGFRGLALNRENYAPRNSAKPSKTHTLPQLQLVGDRLMVLYCYRDNPTISCAILEVPAKGFGSTLAAIASANEGTRHAFREPVQNGSYANVTPEQKYSCVRETSSRTRCCCNQPSEKHVRLSISRRG